MLAARFLFPCVPAALLVGAAPGRWDRQEPGCHTGTSSFYLKKIKSLLKKITQIFFNISFFPQRNLANTQATITKTTATAQ